MSVAVGARPPDLHEVLDDLCMRFVNNLPPSEYESFERLFFAVEAAHWFYDDFHREENRALPRLPLKAFAAKIFAHSPLLQPYVHDVDELTLQFRTYKFEVPTCGAAMLTPDMTKVLLVCGWGKNGKWGFPKGKIGKDETELEAAVREVYEETGFDFSAVLPPDPEDETLAEEPYFIDSLAGGKLSRIFVVPNVPEDTVFETRTRKEISAIKWIPLASLPDPRSKQNGAGGGRNGADGNCGGSSGNLTGNGPLKQGQGQQAQLKAKQYWLVSQYVPKLKSFVKRRRKQLAAAGNGSVSKGKLSVVSNQTAVERHLPPAPHPEEKDGEHAVGTTETPQKKTKQEKAHGRKARAASASERDKATFGANALQTPSGSGAMTAEERDAFFGAYVLQADKRKEELGIGDDFWPVPVISSKDIARKSHRGAAFADPSPIPRVTEDLLSPKRAENATTGDIEGGSFSFDRESVLACLL